MFSLQSGNLADGWFCSLADLFTGYFPVRPVCISVDWLVDWLIFSSIGFSLTGSFAVWLDKSLLL